MSSRGQGEFFCLLHGNLYTALDYRPFFGELDFLPSPG
jgi:hypothetical protein